MNRATVIQSEDGYAYYAPVAARLTPAQSRAATRLNAELLALSRERRAFSRSVRAMAWDVHHVPELWAAHVGRRFPHLEGRI